MNPLHQKLVDVNTIEGVYGVKYRVCSIFVNEKLLTCRVVQHVSITWFHTSLRVVILYGPLFIYKAYLKEKTHPLSLPKKPEVKPYPLIK